MADDRSERLRQRRREVRERDEPDEPAESDKTSEQSKPSKTSESDETSKTSKQSKPSKTSERDESDETSEQSKQSKPSKLEKTDEPDKTDKPRDSGDVSVKKEQVGTYMYLRPSQKRELDKLYKLLSAEYEYEFDEDFEKNRHFYPLVIEHGIAELDGSSADELRELIDRLPGS